jgi:hypothetical protein
LPKTLASEIPCFGLGSVASALPLFYRNIV